MEIKFNETIGDQQAIVLVLCEGSKLSPTIEKLNKKYQNQIDALVAKHQFKGKAGEKIVANLCAKDQITQLVLVGAGKEKDLTSLALAKIGGNLYSYLTAQKIKDPLIVFEHKKEADNNFMLEGFLLKSYKFEKYKTKPKKEDKFELSKATVFAHDLKLAKEKHKLTQIIADSVFFTRDLVSEPPNVIYPESYAKQCQTLEKFGIEVEVLGLKEMKKLGMGALLGVAQGSVCEPRLVILKWNGLGKSSKKAPIAFVGKGVTFDTGGISIKPAGGMEDMKYDMAGSAVVAGLLRTLAARKAKVNAIGILGLVENMPDGNAQRPSDVVYSMSGQTIEVLNTDAEGRLVLADALWYCQNRFKPEFIVDLATLTGAIVVTFGNIFAGLFSNDDKLSANLEKTGQKTGERLWRLPLDEEYNKQINSGIADMQNLGEKGAGSITAAEFLQRFVNKTPWAHLDIAGMAWTKKDLDLVPKGATAFGVRLLNQLVQDYYEKSSS